MSAAGLNVLALDLSTRTGWAVGRPFSSPAYGTWVLGKMAEGGRVLSCLANEIEDAIAVFAPDCIVIEAPLTVQAQTHNDTARLLLGLAAVASMVGYEHGYKVEEHHAQTVRRLVMGSARQKKPDIVAWAEREGWHPPDDNAADALALLRYRHLLARSRITAGHGST